MPPRIPTQPDFTGLSPSLTFTLHFPSPPESITAILLLFHGLGDSHIPFANFARAINLPGVLCIAVRGVNPLPLGFLAAADGLENVGSEQATGHWMWSDDMELSSSSGQVEGDARYEKAWDLIMGKLVRDTLVTKLGWNLSDVLMFGFGQGGSMALEMAARAAQEHEAAKAVMKGVISIGGPLPPARVVDVGEAKREIRTPVLLCHGSTSESIDEDAIETLKGAFANIKVVKWRKPVDSMPANREEMLPIMQFFADKLRSY